MAVITSRRLRVRDDGTGNASAIDRHFAEFESEDAIVLLGDPGMGKTTLFKGFAGANYQTVRTFLIAPTRTDDNPVFLDALDEYRSTSGGRSTPDEIAKALIALGRPRFRLSCRAADWFGAADQEIIRLASASGRIVVLDLCPLSQEEIIEAVRDTIPDPKAFLREAEEAGLTKLLTNPQSLQLVACAWSSDKKPRNKHDTFEIGISELIREANPEHMARGADRLDTAALRRASGAAASVLLLSNAAGISRTDPTDDGGYINVFAIPHGNPLEIDFALKRRLFTSLEADRFEPIHRTVAEFLAAEDLSQRIASGLPIDRVMALTCGLDDVPVSSLRGVFAWLMSKLGPIAEIYVGRDPYGIATYGDASVLSPAAQCAIWQALRGLSDPWFLANEDDRGSFRNLANPNTTSIIREILSDTNASVHLKIAALEAIANSGPDPSMRFQLRAIVLEKHDNTWLRSTALRAFATSVNLDNTELERLDQDLATAIDDIAAPEVRVDVLKLIATHGYLPPRLLSILKQAASTRGEHRTFGRFYPLLSLASDVDLDALLDGACDVLVAENLDRHELRYLFDEWLKRRLCLAAPPSAAQLCKWLHSLRLERDGSSDEVDRSLKLLFAREQGLFEAVFDRLSVKVTTQDRSFWLFVAHDVWVLLPSMVWPEPHAEFFLRRAAKETTPDRAADLFRMFLSRLPPDGGSANICDEAWEVIAVRRDLRDTLGGWTSCEIPQWRLAQFRRKEQRTQEQIETRDKNVSYLESRVASIEAGIDQKALEWAASAYLGLFIDVERDIGPKARLVDLTSEEIANSLIAGIIRYLEQPNIPSKETVIGWWEKNSFPQDHFLLCLSVFLRHCANMEVPSHAIPQAIAAVATTVLSSDRVDNYKECLTSWLLEQVSLHPAVLMTVLEDLWIRTAAQKRGILPGFYELRDDDPSRTFVSKLAANVLSTGLTEDHDTVRHLVHVLLKNDRHALMNIGASELARTTLTPEVRAIWTVALFAVDEVNYNTAFHDLFAQSENVMWEAIEMLGGEFPHQKGAARLTSEQRATIIQLVGARFQYVELPSDGWWGSRNPWQAAEFVRNQIVQLAADDSSEIDQLLEKLERSTALQSYREFICHHRAQRARRRRETGFTFASAKAVGNALRNKDPANSNDLLAFVIEHLKVLKREIRNAPTERYRAYWNEKGRALQSPKHEEVCVGFLADDLQRRIHPYGLVVTVEHHLVADKECDLVVLQGTERLLPIEVKHHYHRDLWTAWSTQLDRLYTRDPKAGGLGIYLVLWSGEAKERQMPPVSNDLARPANAAELHSTLEALVPEKDRNRLRVIVVDISPP